MTAKYLFVAAVLISIVFTTLLFGFSLLVPTVARPALDGQFIDCNTGWYITGDNQKGTITLPYTCDTTPGEPIRVSRMFSVPEMEDYYLCTRSAQQHIKAYWNDTLIYEYGNPETLMNNVSSGSTWNFIPLADYAGRQGQVTIEICSTHPKYGSYLHATMAGPYSSIVLMLFMRNGGDAVVALATLAVGTLLLVGGLYFFQLLRTRSLTHLGMFCILVSIWSLCESHVIDLLVPYPPFILYISCLCLMFFPLFFMAFLKGMFLLGKQWLYDLAFSLTFLNCIVCILLQLIGVVQLQLVIFTTHIMIIADMVVMIILVVQECRKTPDKGEPLFFAAWGTLLFFSVIDMGMYEYHLYIKPSDTYVYGRLFRLGFWVFMIILSAMMAKQILATYKRSFKADVYREMLQVDILTGLYTRRAFDEDMEQWRTDAPGANFHMLFLDMNDLKGINDTYGHKAGDEAIINAANTILAAVKERGRCYRLGGDEFVVVLPDILPEQVETIVGTIAEQVLDPYGRPSLAIGAGRFDPTADADVFALFARVDAKMYQNKRVLKTAYI